MKLLVATVLCLAGSFVSAENKSKCKICGTLLSQEGGGSTKSMKKHLDAKHGAEFKEYVKKKSEEELKRNSRLQQQEYVVTNTTFTSRV
uniref:BED-type domain-containing protein n=1 Tax=Romanomermis culicivorax TaxID=13658 RepID=A0A915KKL2_ROMCU